METWHSALSLIFYEVCQIDVLQLNGPNLVSV